MGSFSNNHFINFAKETILTAIPITKESKKLPFIDFHNALNPSNFKTFIALKLTELILSNNSSYIPEIKAIVPPETPGTTSAAPIAIPLSEIIIYSFKLRFIY